MEVKHIQRGDVVTISALWVWMGIAALALVGELLSGTFYLLIVAVGMVTAGIIAGFNLELGWQLLGCVAGIGACTFILRKFGILRKDKQPVQSNANVNLDIGQHVQVTQWNELRQTTVTYRGAVWQAQLQAGFPPQTGLHAIAEIRGSMLILQPLPCNP